jgi:hypothetical protein
VTGDVEVAAAGAVQARAMAEGRAEKLGSAWADGAILDFIMTSLHIR